MSASSPNIRLCSYRVSSKMGLYSMAGVCKASAERISNNEQLVNSFWQSDTLCA